MRTENRQIREKEIETAALRLLEEKGYAGTTVQAVARAAKASNETLYRWYGDKRGLFAALVRRNAAQTAELLDSDAPDRLEQMGPVLLRMLLSDQAILLNRAAAADPTGELGKTIAEHGRALILPRLIKAFATLVSDTESAAETYVALLIGDQQIRRVIGVIPRPSDAEISARAEKALQQTLSFYG